MTAGFWDGSGGRIAAVIVIVICVAALGFIHRNDLFPPEKPKAAKLNPEFVKCRKQRLTPVDNMLDQRVITQAQHATFKGRALAFCTARFPPEGRKRPGGAPPRR